jgi:hypothetical protein
MAMYKYLGNQFVLTVELFCKKSNKFVVMRSYGSELTGMYTVTRHIRFKGWTTMARNVQSKLMTRPNHMQINWENT